ncbi:hypothetical protein [Neodiprion sertifer nucleopolyhedrovirus]|uniref:Uncharacterized protein n=1 Tax=Neodiprion sertifer nucleopolyhedrovirus TaxID=111874 RepID=Q6JKF0_9CBAC|nr:hypothetical protein NeseNPV_gp10 [Neodiprion sertifer nucleopolyhedrovirus]AAQ96387.1 hypothetical protein [Neodiprion sertifer nucleopolyhedrovirus]
MNLDQRMIVDNNAYIRLDPCLRCTVISAMANHENSSVLQDLLCTDDFEYSSKFFIK